MKNTQMKPDNTFHPTPWWDSRWRMRTTVTRPTPYRDEKSRPVEVAVDFPLLLERAGIIGEFHPASIRVIKRAAESPEREVSFAYRTALR